MWNLDLGAPVPAWRASAAEPGLLLAFSTRLGGVSEPPYDTLNLGRSTADGPAAVEENRRRLLATLGVAPERLVTAGQVHGARVREAEAPGHLEACDALLTRAPGLVLAVTTADCMPLLFTAPGAVAAAHAGWRGTVEGAPRATLEAVGRAAGVSPGRVAVHLGPCIRVCCYRVGAEVADRFPAAAVRVREGGPHLDLPRAAFLQLRAAGLPDHAFHDLGVCTACDSRHYYSHRRDGGRTGRHWAMIALSAAAATKTDRRV